MVRITTFIFLVILIAAAAFAGEATPTTERTNGISRPAEETRGLVIPDSGLSLDGTKIIVPSIVNIPMQIGYELSTKTMTATKSETHANKEK